MICHDQVEVVTHNKVCHGAVADIPPALARFLGDVSGLAEFVDNKVMFCRHAACWSLDLRNNTWTRAASLHVSYCYDKLCFSSSVIPRVSEIKHPVCLLETRWLSLVVRVLMVRVA